jgi:hypothetical protein
MAQVLLTTQIPLRGLHRDMGEQELNLFQLAAAGVAQLGARPAQVMRGDVPQPYAAAVSVHEVPDNVFADAIAPNRSILADGAEYSSAVNLGCRCPAVQLVFDLKQNRNGSNMTALPNQVHNHPMPLTDLYLFEWQVASIAQSLRCCRRSPQFTKHELCSRLNQLPERCPSCLAPFTR